jgi:UDP-N-acetylglucosamine 2-epimerase
LNFDPFAKYGGVGAVLDLSGGYLIVMQHPVTTEYGVARQQITETLLAVRDLDIPALWFWPNVDAGSDGTSEGIRAFRESTTAQNIHFFKNMTPEDFLRLAYNSRCIVGNSSVGIRECSFLGVPAVNIGTRQSGRERGRNVTDAGYDRDEITEAINRHLNNGHLPSNTLYGDGKAGARIADLLGSVPLRMEKHLTY